MNDRNAKTYQINARVDIKELASLHEMYTRLGTTFRSQADLIRQIIRDFHTIMEKQDQVSPITQTDLAIQIMKDCGMGNGIKITKKALIDSINMDDVGKPAQTLDQAVDGIMKRIMK
jgi:hypothetical protein